MLRHHLLFSVLAAASVVLSGFVSTPVQAQQRPVLLRDSFPIGDGGGILCQVQDRSVENPVKQSMFDRSWTIVCRDSPQAVANIYAFRGFDGDPASLMATVRRDGVDCAASTATPFSGVADAQRTMCAITDTGLEWSSISATRGQTTYVAEGFAAYDAATTLALLSVIDNSIASGTIDVASTSVSDPLSFARAQAETLKPGAALAEGYRRNLSGEYAEAAAYFEALQRRLEGDESNTRNVGEFIINRALQKSNLTEFGVAERLFAEAAPQTKGDMVAERLQRNFEAIHLINQGYLAEALERLDQPLSDGIGAVADVGGSLAITVPLADRLNSGEGSNGLLGFVDELKLSPEERAVLIDAQALQLRGTILRISGDLAGAEDAMLDSYAKAIAVREGRVTSIARLRAQILGELALVAERRGNNDRAETYLRNSLALLEAQYPDNQAVSASKARLGAFLLRQGRDAEAITLYRSVIDSSLGKRNAISGFSNQLRPYFRLIAPLVETDPGFAEDFFKASQVLVRPGVAETQAVLSRELSASSNEGSRLFRQSLDLGRDIERLRIQFQALAKRNRTAVVSSEMSELATQIDLLERDQLRTQAELNDYPQYRVVAPRSLSLSDFRASLDDGEAYARMSIVGGDAFMFYTDKSFATAYRIALSEVDLEFEVDMLRASISAVEGGRYVTYPFEVAMARNLHTALLGPVEAKVAAVGHLVFEPDGAMLRLPVDILVVDDASVATYEARANAPDGDPFDFTGVAWLGRDKMISTAVSAQAFVDARKAPRSSGTRQYLGLGRNIPIGDTLPSMPAVNESDRCRWAPGVWNQPIDDRELLTAQRLIGEGNSQVLTGAEFTDAAIMGKADLSEFRILHFATHGLVTPPNPDCPAKPALLTSFGGEGSDGLLSFDEIFELNLDADIVILSACDTAGGASIEATRAAGIGSGGGTALDGLVRSFIGAGGRTIMASHWPAPDDYNATERLISEMFRVGRDQDLGLALRASQRQLMDDADTSHPYYWGGFSIIGDASRPLLSGAPAPAPTIAALTQ